VSKSMSTKYQLKKLENEAKVLDEKIHAMKEELAQQERLKWVGKYVAVINTKIEFGGSLYLKSGWLTGNILKVLAVNPNGSLEVIGYERNIWSGGWTCGIRNDSLPYQKNLKWVEIHEDEFNNLVQRLKELLFPEEIK